MITPQKQRGCLLPIRNIPFPNLFPGQHKLLYMELKSKIFSYLNKRAPREEHRPSPVAKDPPIIHCDPKLYPTFVPVKTGQYEPFRVSYKQFIERSFELGEPEPALKPTSLFRLEATTPARAQTTQRRRRPFLMFAQGNQINIKTVEKHLQPATPSPTRPRIKQAAQQSAPTTPRRIRMFPSQRKRIVQPPRINLSYHSTKKSLQTPQQRERNRMRSILTVQQSFGYKQTELIQQGKIEGYQQPPETLSCGDLNEYVQNNRHFSDI